MVIIGLIRIPLTASDPFVIPKVGFLRRGHEVACWTRFLPADDHRRSANGLAFHYTACSYDDLKQLRPGLSDFVAQRYRKYGGTIIPNKC